MVFAGIYARACQLANPKDDRTSGSEEGGMEANSIWVSADESEAVSSALAPKLKQAEKGVEELLFEVVTLQVIMHPPLIHQ